LARPGRLELPTYCLEGSRSIRLSYGRVKTAVSGQLSAGYGKCRLIFPELRLLTTDSCDTGAPRETRTPDLRMRSPALYPTELWARGVNGGTRTLNPWSHSPVLCH